MKTSVPNCVRWNMPIVGQVNLSVAKPDRFPWPASLTAQGRQQKTVACPRSTQLTHLFHIEP
jgi:hypothetical protein